MSSATATIAHPQSSSRSTHLHPLDPLDASEIDFAVAATRRGLSERGCDISLLRFIWCSLYEPTKLQLLSGEPIERTARVETWDKRINETRVSLVSLISGSIIKTDIIPNVQPALCAVEYEVVERVVRSYPPFREAMESRGYNPDRVCMDAWCPGYFDERDGPSRRLIWPSLYLHEVDSDNTYGRPIEGIDMRVDLQTEEVIWFRDTARTPIPARDEFLNFPRPPTDYRTELKPLRVIQPDGPSFQVHGNLVTWQGWSFRVGFNAREGLTIHQVCYKDLYCGETRPIAYRMSFCEMVVPYGDPHSPHYRKNAFDAGEDGLGCNANTLDRGCDCLGWIKYFDFDVVDFFGNTRKAERVVCLHEEDHGVLWKHTNWRSGSHDVRRSRRLVISFFCTIANYDYGFYISFYQDAGIEFEVKLTGIISTGTLLPGEDKIYGQRISPNGLYSPIHQHFFAARLDMMVDGVNNRVVEVETVPDSEGEHNPFKNAFTLRRTVLTTELEACRDSDPMLSRAWHIQSSTRKARNGVPTAYRLVPRSSVLSMTHRNAAILRRAGFVKHNLWVTPFDINENFPGGDFPSQSPRIEGLPKYVTQNRNVMDTDLVLWHIFGISHMPRLEDWPVMPVEHVGFFLKPYNFFAANPAIDVPPSVKEARCDLEEEKHCEQCNVSSRSRL